jgi:hypothetical protein
MDALKESAPPPWKLAKPGSVPSVPLTRSSSSSSAGDNSGPGGMGGGGSEEVERETIEQEEGGPGGREVLPAAPAQVSAAGEEGAVLMSIGKGEGEGAGEQEIGTNGVPKSSSSTSSASSGPITPSSASSTTTPTSTANSTSSSTPPPLPPRILRKKHFTLALREISPSSAEGSSLEELRKWASKFGEGGTERGKKGGYGGKFGFGDAKEGGGLEEESEYGRVRPGST